MMPLSELMRLAATIDGQRCSPAADMVAARWALPAGAARFRRSSACHVFAVPTVTGSPDGGFLRFLPARLVPPERADAIAELTHRLGRLGLPVAVPVPSRHARLVETVETPLGAMVASLVTAAPGRQYDVDELNPAQARSWGATLARLHDSSADLREVALPDPLGELNRAERVPTDPPVVEAVNLLRTALDKLPRDRDRVGVVHGDFELDNLCWHAGAVTAFDFDDAGRSWFVGDIAHAWRDLWPGTGPWADRPLTTDFLAGYRAVRDLPDADLDWLPTFAAAHAATWLVRVPAILDLDPAPAEPPWLTTLRGKLLHHADRQRILVRSVGLVLP